MNATSVLAMLKNLTKYKPAKDEAPPKTLEKRLKICDFLVQAGWLDEAERELGRVDEEIPGFTDKIESVRCARDSAGARGNRGSEAARRGGPARLSVEFAPNLWRQICRRGTSSGKLDQPRFRSR